MVGVGKLSDELSDDYETRIRQTFTFGTEDVPGHLRMPDRSVDNVIPVMGSTATGVSAYQGPVLRRPEWYEWGMLSDELSDDYETRIRQTFTFRTEDVPEHLRMPDHHTDGRSAGAKQGHISQLAPDLDFVFDIMCSVTYM